MYVPSRYGISEGSESFIQFAVNGKESQNLLLVFNTREWMAIGMQCDDLFQASLFLLVYVMLELARYYMCTYDTSYCIG